MSQVKLFLDLDRTLFDTKLFGELKFDLLQKHFPSINPIVERTRQRDFYVRNGEMYYYDFTEHMNYLGLPTTLVYKVVKESMIADGRLEYHGVKELINWARQNTELKILTYGKDDYQELKAALCPSIVGVELVITQRPKEEFFHSEGFNGEAWMVDDKEIRGLPRGVSLIQVSLDGADFEQHEQWYQVRSLEEVLKILQKT